MSLSIGSIGLLVLKPIQARYHQNKPDTDASIGTNTSKNYLDNMVAISTAITTIFGAMTALFGAITTTLPSKVLNTTEECL